MYVFTSSDSFSVFCSVYEIVCPVEPFYRTLAVCIDHWHILPLFAFVDQIIIYQIIIIRSGYFSEQIAEDHAVRNHGRLKGSATFRVVFVPSSGGPLLAPSLSLPLLQDCCLLGRFLRSSLGCVPPSEGIIFFTLFSYRTFSNIQNNGVNNIVNP